jgi:ficolin
MFVKIYNVIIYIVDCQSLLDEGRARYGVNSIYVEGLGHRSVYCVKLQDVGWTVIQRRYYGNVNFTRGMDDYVNGFGDLEGDHWIGLEMLHKLTNIPGTTSSVIIGSKEGNGKKAAYQGEYNVSVGDRASGYMLHVGIADTRPSSVASKYTVTPIKGLRSGDGMRFSTVDHDLGSNCSAGMGGGGGWWYGRGPEGCSYLLINAILGRKGNGGTSVDGGSSYSASTWMYVKRN